MSAEHIVGWSLGFTITVLFLWCRYLAVRLNKVEEAGLQRGRSVTPQFGLFGHWVYDMQQWLGIWACHADRRLKKLERPENLPRGYHSLLSWSDRVSDRLEALEGCDDAKSDGTECDPDNEGQDSPGPVTEKSLRTVRILGCRVQAKSFQVAADEWPEGVSIGAAVVFLTKRGETRRIAGISPERRDGSILVNLDSIIPAVKSGTWVKV